MNDKQIRLEILLDFYKAMRNQTPIPGQEDSEKLREIDGKDYQFNYGYLIKHHLLNGKSRFSTDGIEHFSPTGGITEYGLDIVETFVEKCVENVKQSKNKIIDKTMSIVNTISELVSIWAVNADLYQQAWELLSSIIN